MKRKLIALVLAAAAVLSLAGCGSDEKEGPDSDLAYIQDKGYLTVGITEFAPMDYKDADGNWIGFDADMARAFAKSIGVDAVFTPIDWEYKHQSLRDKSIDVVWNGMTLNDTVRQQMAVSKPYCRNAQVVVVPAYMVSRCRTEDDLKALDIIAEDNSAGAKALTDIGLVYTPVDSQLLALSGVTEESANACVIDQFMAAAMTGPGTDHPNLVVAMELNRDQAEEIVVGFRTGSDLVATFNQFWADACADGTVDSTAAAYGMSDFVLKP